MAPSMMPELLFLVTLDWLRDNYRSFGFFNERDVVWTVQKQLSQLMQDTQFPLRVFHDFPLVPRRRRALCCDLALVEPDDNVVLTVEFKFEPDHLRSDIWPTKFPVVFWGVGVQKDCDRVRSFVQEGRTPIAYSLFIDEGGYFARTRPAPPGSKWIAWPTGPSVLVTRAPAN